MYCNNCGIQNPDGVKFCSNCGGQLQAAPVQPEYNAAPVQPTQQPYNAAYTAPQPEKKKKGKMIGIIAGVVALLVVIGIVIIVIVGGENKNLDSALIGTWEHIVTEELDPGYDVSLYTYVEFNSDGTYETYVDREKTTDSIKNTVKRYFSDKASIYSITFEEAVKKTGYESIDEFIDEVFQLDEMEEAINAEGYWEAEDGIFYDLYEQGSRENADILDYSVSDDGETLEFDDLTWTRGETQVNTDNDSDKNENNDKNTNTNTSSSLFGSAVSFIYPDGLQVKYNSSVNLTINGKEISLPCKLSDFLDATGLGISEYEVSSVSADGYETIMIEDNGIVLWTSVENLSNQEISIYDGIVTGIEIEEDEGVETSSKVIIGSGLKLGMTYDEVVEELGKPSYDFYKDAGELSYDKDESIEVYVYFDFSSQKVSQIEVDIYDADYDY